MDLLRMMGVDIYSTSRHVQVRRIVAQRAVHCSLLYVLHYCFICLSTSESSKVFN